VTLFRLLGCGLLAAVAATRLAAQDSLPPWRGGTTASLGQPSRTSFYTGGSLGLDWRRGYEFAPAGYVLVGVTHDPRNPVQGLLGLTAEGYAGLRSTQVDGGLRFLLQFPLVRLSFGGDYNLRDNRLGFLLGLTLPIRRGGLLTSGSVLRAEWSASPLAALRVTALLPLGQPAAGRTRPRGDRVDIPSPAARPIPAPAAAADLEAALATVRPAVRRMGRLVVPALDRPGADPRAALAPLIAELRDTSPVAAPGGAGLGVEALVRRYHRELARAWSVAASGTPLPEAASTAEGDTLAAWARRELRDYVLYPYDHLLGQWKTTNTLAGLAAHARGNFARDVVSLTALPPDRETAVLYVFDQLLAAIIDLERRQRDDWKDSRDVWLPLQLGLRPEDHDTQAELDSVVEAVSGVRFSNGNRVWYIVNEQFQAEVIRSIQQAEDYHVLWIHDFRGRNDAGQPDVLALRYVIDAYLRALARGIRDYDRRRRLPLYMVFLDQHYYEANAGRLWLDVLEHPLGPLPRLPVGFEAQAKRLETAQAELRAAVESSRLLQAEARQYGEPWLANQVKVHVSVTNPVDHSFRSRQIVPFIGMPDDVMRDHRKLVFYDISEEDPYRGLAIYTGMGIGEHYAGPTWEDRAVMVQGPAVLSLKAQARRLLESQGIASERIPYPLRNRPLPPEYRAAVEAEIARRRSAGGRDQRAVELHNQTGFGEKQVSVARAALYSLMPVGSVVKVPDSLWGNSLLASLLTGSALRGCRVLFVAPSRAAAPATGAFSMALTHDLFARLIVLQQELGPELEAAGGMLKTGFYNPGIGVQDLSGRLAAAYRNARRTPFLRRLYPVDPTIDTLLAHAADRLPQVPASDSARATPAQEIMPKLHLKAGFFASREGWDRLVARPEMAEVLQAYIGQLLRTDPESSDVRVAAGALASASDRLEAAFHQSLSPEERERVVYYLMIGSANEDYRSMFMDGEASMLLSGWSGVVGLIDFSLIMNLSVWVDDLEMLDALLPPPTRLQRRISRIIRPTL